MTKTSGATSPYTLYCTTSQLQVSCNLYSGSAPSAAHQARTQECSFEKNNTSCLFSNSADKKWHTYYPVLWLTHLPRKIMLPHWENKMIKLAIILEISFLLLGLLSNIMYSYFLCKMFRLCCSQYKSLCPLSYITAQLSVTKFNIKTLHSVYDYLQWWWRVLDLVVISLPKAVKW